MDVQTVMDPPTSWLDYNLKTWGNICMNMGSRALVLAGCSHRGYCSSERRIDGKTVVITGANTGIGFTTADFLWKRGGNVVMVCRDKGRGERAMDKLKRSLEPGSKVGSLSLVLMDLASLSSVREGASQLNKTLDRIDILINNAGVMATPYTLTEDGFELQFQVNYLGLVLFTFLLLPKIQASSPARIVNVSSIAGTFYLLLEDLNDEKKFFTIFAYFRSKAAVTMFSRELGNRLRGKWVNVYALNPGYIPTDLFAHSSKTFFPGFNFIIHNLMACYVKDHWEGIQTTVHCAICEAAEEETGLYYDECRVAKTPPLLKDDEKIKLLWDKTMAWLDLDPDIGGLSPRRSPSGKEDELDHRSLTAVSA